VRPHRVVGGTVRRVVDHDVVLRHALGLEAGGVDYVTKRLEQIYITLGVENRSSAATITVRVARAE
jgi:PleD family two-component response regulator